MNTPITVDDNFAKDPFTWLETKAAAHNLAYLLAHADDGVIWGRFDRTFKLVISGQVFAFLDVKLRADTLQELRLFGPSGEMILWRTEDGFSARLIVDGQQDGQETIDDVQLLWGKGQETRSDFTLMVEGERGLHHALPMVLPTGSRAKLQVRHYLDHDEEGQTYIAFSRIVDLQRV